jgi:plastocyanin
MRWSSMFLLSALVVALLPTASGKADAVPKTAFRLSIVNQMFEPNTLTIPAGQTVKVMVKNKDSLPAEFEGRDFHVEVVIPGKAELPVYIRPLNSGTYHFFNDFHPESKGTLIVKKAAQ